MNETFICRLHTVILPDWTLKKMGPLQFCPRSTLYTLVIFYWNFCIIKNSSKKWPTYSGYSLEMPYILCIFNMQLGGFYFVEFNGFYRIHSSIYFPGSLREREKIFYTYSELNGLFLPVFFSIWNGSLANMIIIIRCSAGKKDVQPPCCYHVAMHWV